MVAGTLVVAGCGRLGFEPVGLPGWSHSVQLRILNAGRTERLEDFPLLVVLDASRIDPSFAAADGHDLRFIDESSGSEIAYEIEAWRPAGRSLVWVRAPAIPAASNASVITMYYGNPTAPPSRVSSVWSSEFVGVFHMAGSFTDTGPLRLDTIPQDVGFSPGQVGDAMTLSPLGPASYGLIPQRAELADIVTISGWIKQDTQPIDYSALATIPISDLPADALHLGWHADRPYGEATDRAHTLTRLEAAARQSGGWTHLGLVIDGSTATLFVDGAVAASMTLAAPPSPPTFGVFVGADCDACPNGTVVANADFLNGAIDELRLERAPRSAAWFDAVVATMRDEMIAFE